VLGFLKEHRAFAILAEYGHHGSNMAPIGAELGIPVFAYWRGFDASKRLGSPLRILSYRAALPRLAGYFAVSRSLLDNLAAQGIRHPNAHVIPSGVDTARFAPGANDPHLIVAIGRLIPKKRPDLTIEAFGRLAGSFPAHRLEIVGDGPLRSPCEAAIERLGLTGRVTLHGFQPHDAVRDLLARAALFLQHSVTDDDGNEEGLPIAIQEAMASGAAVVSTRHAGISDAVDHGRNGLLVAENDLEGYVAAIRSLLADDGARARLAAAAREKAEAQFDTARLHRRLEAVILDACGARAGP
jgi:colanic acid/amylovoran biosynthesis glycosyltransferase